MINNFSQLKGNDLKELLTQVEKFPFLYRELLNFPENISMGVEVEFEKANVHLIWTFMKNYPGWKIKKDYSLKNGLEINTPIMYNQQKDWQALKEVLQELQKEKVNSHGHAGTHFHLGTPILGNDVASWQNFLLMYAYYEDILVHFFYGERTKERITFKRFSQPLAPLLSASVDKIVSLSRVENIMAFFPHTHESAISLNNVVFQRLNKNEEYNTIEFRAPNGTINETVCQNNINAGVWLLLGAKNNNIDKEYLAYQLKNHPISTSQIYLYRYINISKALEFCDLVFKDEMDKIYFLKQYLKGYQENKGMILERKIKF